MNKPSLDHTHKKEAISRSKLVSAWGILAGERAHQFDAFLEAAPTTERLTKVIMALRKQPVMNAIFDLDGTLVRPYQHIPPEVVGMLKEYQVHGRKVAIYTNSKHTPRLDVLKDHGITVAETGKGKPNLEAFQRLCDTHGFDPAQTAMIGNSPITDMPLVPNGEEPLFNTNILVNSIPPNKEDIPSTLWYVRAQIIHWIAAGAAKIVLARNKEIYRG